MSEGRPQGRLARRSIFGEFLLFTMLIIVPFSLVASWYVFRSFSRITEQLSLQSLESLAQSKARTIGEYIDGQFIRAETLSLTPTCGAAMARFEDAFTREGPNSEAYRRAESEYSQFFELYLEHWGYYDLFLINTEGLVVHSVKQESDFGSNLRTGAYKDTGLARVFKQAQRMLQTNNSTFAEYAPSGAAGAFVATPIMKEGVLIGVLALQFDTRAIYEIANNYSGLGSTGEIVIGQIIDGEILVMAPLRHDPNAAFERTIDLAAQTALPIREGASGNTGTGIVIDWRGEEVLAVWQYVPALRWGMVVKIDTVEVFARWINLERALGGYIGFGLLLTYLLLLFLVDRITRPLRELTRATLDYAAGRETPDMSRLLTYDNETGVLTAAFVQMLERVSETKAQLKGVVRELAENNRTLDRRVAEQTEHLRAVVDCAADGVIAVGQDGVVLSVNPAASRIFGHDADALVGESMAILLPERYASSYLDELETRVGFDSSMALGMESELQGLRASGEVFPADLRVSEMRVQEQKLFLCTIRDISSRKQMEAEQRRMAMAVQQAHDAILITDALGEVAYVNPAYEALFGLSVKDVLGQTLHSINSGAVSSAQFQEMWATISAGQAWRAELPSRRKDGRVVEVDQAISPIIDAQQETIGYVSVQRDITQEKREREQLQHSQRLESLGVLAGGIAHDFNNLLTAILGNAGLARTVLPQHSPADELLDNVESASMRAAELCKQMLAYSGKGQFVVQRVNLTALVREMLTLVEVSIQKNVVLRFELSDTLPDIEADAAQMQQIIMNLVINASEAIEDNRGVIRVRTDVVHLNKSSSEANYLKEDLAPGEYVCFEISDTGCGMSEATIERIFDPFFTTKFTGRGLGMSAILGIVRGHHGAISIRSQVGRGSTFRVLLPSTSGCEIDVPAGNLDIEPVGGRGTILIVDDEESILKTAAMILESAGFEVLSARDGQEAVDLYATHHHAIRAVLLDMTMPVMGGQETFEALRKVDPAVVVVLTSGYSEEAATESFEGLGLSGFIQKPYTAKELRKKFIGLLDA